MRAFLEVLAVLLILAQIELAQDTTTCESHKDGDVNITVCTSGEYKSVMSCNHDGSSCTSTTRRLKDAEDSDENLRKFCTAGLDGDCDNLAVRVERRKKVGSICDEDYVRTHEPEKCKKEADELKLNEEIVSKWLETGRVETHGQNLRTL